MLAATPNPPLRRCSPRHDPEGIEVSGTALVASPAGAMFEVSRTRPGRTSSTARVDLTDPGHFWRDTTLADAGCPGDLEPYWNWAGSGDTRRAAVDDLLAEMATPHRTFTGVERAEIGYIDASSQTWLVHRNGRIYMTASVHPRKLDAGVPDPAGGYAAYAGSLCQA